MRRNLVGHVLMVLVMSTISFAVVGCDNSSPTAPTQTPSVTSPTPTPPAPTPTPTPTGFSFIFLGPEATGMEISQLPTWGLRDLNTELLVKQLVFGDASAFANPGLRPLHRLRSGAISVSIPAELEGKMNEFQKGADAFQVLTGIEMTFVSTVSPFSIKIGDTKFNGVEYAAVTERSWDTSGYITSATIVFKSYSDINTWVTTHEMAHVFGLCHHNGVGSLGSQGGYSSQSYIGYSLMELDNATMMLRLPAGVPYPSTSGTSFLATSSVSSERIQ